MARRDRRASPLVDSLAVGFRRGSRRFDAPGDRSILRYVSSLIKQSFGSIGGSVMGIALLVNDRCAIGLDLSDRSHRPTLFGDAVRRRIA
jgi:hypothetical protein